MMKPEKTRLRHSLCLAVLLAPALSHGAVTVTGSLTAPVTDAADQFHLPGATDDVNNIDGTGIAPWDNDASTYIAADKTSQGMTFTTGSNPQGYILSSITIQHALLNNWTDNGTWSDVVAGDSWEFQFGTISGNTKSVLFDTDTATLSGAGFTQLNPPANTGTGTFLTFDLTAEGLAILTANTTYYFEIASQGGDPFFEMNGTKTDGYAGGTAFRGTTSATIDGTYLALAGDHAFHADLSAVPEPSAALLGALGLLGLVRRRRA